MTNEKFELALERLRPNKRTQRGASVILSHGFFVNSRFFDLDDDHSLARYLAREGLEVWNLSLRGTGRSLKPLKKAPESWSLDDMVEKDLPAVIRYVRQASGQRAIFWLGYEMGGLLGYAWLERNGSAGLAGLITIGAPATFTHRQQKPLQGILKLEGRASLKKVFLSLNVPVLARLVLPRAPKIEALFYNRENMEDEVREKLLADALAGINAGVFDHLLLMIKLGEFVSAKGDFSYRKNLARIHQPLLLVGGEGDVLAPPETIQAVHRSAGSSDRTMRIFGPKAKDSTAYGHMDLILGRNAGREVFPVIARWLKQRGGDDAPR